jgi:hypothetical protein
MEFVSAGNSDGAPYGPKRNIRVADMSQYGIYEAQRLLKRANEINPCAAALAVRAMQQLAEARVISPSAIYYINSAIPGAALNDKEKELLTA